jgi:hypothetical protein
MDFTVDFTVKVVFVLGDLRVDVLEGNEIRVKTFPKVNSLDLAGYFVVMV